MSGIKDYSIFSKKDEVKSKREISHSANKEEFEQIMNNGGRGRTVDRQEFTNFCGKLILKHKELKL